MKYETCLQFYDVVYKHLLSMTKNVYLAEELTQETFYKAFLHYKPFDSEDRTKMWLFVIARNSYYNHLRYMKHISDIEIEDVMSKPVEKAVESVENLNDIHNQSIVARKLVHELKDEQKEIFFWRVFGDLSFKQIAEIFDESESGVYGKYYKAKQKMIRQIEQIEKRDK